ncbi:hypothetical protein [Pseudodesulfovibrio karagichevae]|uniref:Uncharacterized protein n=1 Tax=Pseudodesulfovibrio karagichevae TaxID=3239305 RepID=A0ABV4JXF3_9BACT
MVEIAIMMTGPERGGIVTTIDPAVQEWGRADYLDGLLIVAVDIDLDTARMWSQPVMEYYDVYLPDGTYDGRGARTVLRHSHGVDLDILGIDLDAIRASEWTVPEIDASQVVAR